MTESLLSDLIGEHVDGRTPDSFDRFLALFRSSTLGIVITGNVQPDGQGGFVAGNDVGAGRTTYGDGRSRVLAWADPEVALRNFGPRFNGGVSGEVLLRMAVDDIECHGILVNSALDEISVVISRETAEVLLSRSAGL
ncbi:hypothetical protein ACIBCD_35095 [Nocardia brasiliensis]|uniref:hypothetical protein n=1 Tax=Nocardia brasiliensis TaxID=37326 RepID=UPI0037A1762D